MTLTEKQAYDRDRYLRLRAERRAREPVDPITTLDETTVAYLAGLTDGDGCIYCTHTNRRKTTYPNVCWAMTDKGTIEWIADLIRARAVVTNNHTNLRRGRTSWGRSSFKVQWKTQVAGSRARLICERMLPYLRTKRQQAELVLRFPVDARRGPGGRLTEEIQAERTSLARQISALNQGA